MTKRKSRMKIALCVLFCLILLGGAAVLGINAYVKGNGADRILSPEQAAELTDAIVAANSQVTIDGTLYNG